MAPAPVNPPTPEDFVGVSTFLEWLRNWGGALFGSGGFVAAFVAGRGTQAIKSQLEEIERSTAEHKIAIEALKAARAAADIKIAELPTRSDLAAGLARTEAQMQAGFQQITTLIRRND
jgi:hypothetical protein